MICSAFVLLFLIFVLHLTYFPYFFLLSISFVILLGWSSALVPSNLAGILINDYYKYIQLATSEVLKKFTVHAGSDDLSLSGRT